MAIEVAPPVYVDAEVVELVVLDALVEGDPLETRVKLAQVNRVLFALWMTIERLPKKAPIPLVVVV